MAKKTIIRKHSTDFYVEKYKELKGYILDKGLEDPYRNLTDFINDYESLRVDGSKNVMKDLKYFSQYETSYKTARAMLAVSKDLGGDFKLKDLKKMSTRAFAEKYEEEIKEAQRNARAMFGEERDEQNRLKWVAYVGREWYGSD